MLEAAIVIGGVVNGPIIGIFTAGYPQLQFKRCYGTINDDDGPSLSFSIYFH